MNVLLESHNIKNLYSGLGQFNYHLVKGLYNLDKDSPKFVLNVRDSAKLEAEFGDFFDFNKYRSISRYPLFRVRRKFDVWHSMNQNTRIEPAYDLPYLTTIHDVNFIKETFGDELKKRKKAFNEKLQRSSSLVYISEFAKKSTHENFVVPNIPERVIYNGNPILKATEYNFDGFNPRANLKDSSYIYTIGQMFEKKNFHTLVEMMMFLPNLKLVIAGKNNLAYADKVRALIKQLNLENRVFLLGEITEKEKYYHYKKCRAFVFPSLLEGFGIPPIEAMSFGKPIFLSNKTSLPEIGGEHAFYWNNFDPEYMAEVFKQGLSVFEANKTVFEQQLKSRAKSFDWAKAAKEYLEVYNSLQK